MRVQSFRQSVVTLSLVFIVSGIGCKDIGSDPPPPPTVPVITRIEPDSARVGEIIELKGSGFEGYRPGYSVRFSPSDIPARTYTKWEDHEIKVAVPEGAKTGPVRVRKETVESNGVTLRIIGTTGGSLVLSPSSVSVHVSQSVSVTVSGGVPPYSITTPPNAALAQATISGSTISITGIAQGSTSLVVADVSSPVSLSATLAIQVTTQQSGVSFSQSIVPIFTSQCTSCHGGTANLRLEANQAYANLVNVPAGTGVCAGMPRVAPGNSAGSALYRRVNGTCSERMPLGGSLSVAQIELIRQWIDEGALNN